MKIKNKEIVLKLLWPFQIIIAFPKSIGLIFKGESFYAYSLGLFYLRQLKLLENKNFYINEVGKINLVSLVVGLISK